MAVIGFIAIASYSGLVSPVSLVANCKGEARRRNVQGRRGDSLLRRAFLRRRGLPITLEVASERLCFGVQCPARLKSPSNVR